MQSAIAMPPHDKTPNMKLVMNPEGKVHDWTELEDEQQLPEIMQHVSNVEFNRGERSLYMEMPLTGMTLLDIYFGCCSADFGPRLPMNQLNHNQNMSQSVRSGY